jgi:hypothetical protein
LFSKNLFSNESSSKSWVQVDSTVEELPAYG